MVTWKTRSIGDLFEFKNGLNKGKEFFGHGAPIINYMDVYNNDGILGHELSGRVDLTPQEIKRFEIHKGDVFFTRTSETPEEVGTACVLLDDVDDGVFSGFVLRGRPKTNELDIVYCKYCFQAVHIRNEIVNSCTYTTRALTNGTQLSKIVMSVPPILEQQAIANALSDVDGYIVALERLIAKKRNIKKGAMQELLTGKRRLPGYDDEWVDKKMEDCLTFEVGYPFKSEMFNQNFIGLRLIKNRDLKSDDQVYHTTESYLPSHLVQNGDILIGMDGDFIPCLWQKGTAVLNQRVGRIRVADMDIRFAYYILMKPLELLQRGTGATTVKHLSHSDVEQLELHIPSSKGEQTAIATALSDIDMEIDTLTEKLNKVRNIKQGMTQELLTGRIRLVVDEVKTAAVGKPAARQSNF